jgi:hypothetical protein
MVWWPPQTALPASFVTRTAARAVQQQVRGKTYPKTKEKGRERENQGSTAMHDGKEKKEENKRKKSATSRFA